MSITNATAIRFCNEKARVAADKLAQAYYFGKEVLDEWYAQNLGTIIPVNGGIVEDGAAIDGRSVITGNDVTNVINRISELVTDYEASGKAKLNTINIVAVNKGM
jgi:hypothetical protein